MNLKDLIARLKTLKAEATAILDEADKNNGGDLTEEQEAQYDAKMTEIEKVNASIDRLKKLNAVGDTVDDLEASAGRQAQPNAAGSQVRVRDNREDDPTAGFSGLGDFALAVQGACMPGGDRDQRLNILGAPSNFHQENGSSDGYEVPPQFRNEIIEVMSQTDDLASMVDNEPTASNQVNLLADESTPGERKAFRPAGLRKVRRWILPGWKPKAVPSSCTSSTLSCWPPTNCSRTHPASQPAGNLAAPPGPSNGSAAKPS